MLNDAEKHDCPVYIRLGSTHKTALVVLAAMRGITQSQAVRDAIVEAAMREVEHGKYDEGLR